MADPERPSEASPSMTWTGVWQSCMAVRWYRATSIAARTTRFGEPSQLFPRWRNLRLPGWRIYKPYILLMGHYDYSLPQALSESNGNGVLKTQRWRHSQVLTDSFWLTFIQQYLPCLQGRSKCQTVEKKFTLDQMVLIVDPQLPWTLWPVGRVVNTHSGVDGHIQSANIKVKNETYLTTVDARW